MVDSPLLRSIAEWMHAPYVGRSLAAKASSCRVEGRRLRLGEVPERVDDRWTVASVDLYP
jgi:hypothetical protein